MEFILLILLIGLFIYFQNKISSIEKRLSQNRETLLVSSVANKIDESNISKDTKQDIKTTTPIEEKTVSVDYVGNFFTWFSKDWILKLGAMFILLGFIWLVSYAFINGIIGETGRILLGLICGSCILLFGHFRIKKYKEQGVIFEVLGSSIMIVTVFSAQFFYSMFTPFIALILILIVVFLTAFSSLTYNSISLIVLSLLIAYISPFLLNSSKLDTVSMLWYVLLVTTGAIWLTFFKNWRFLLGLCAVFVFIYSILTMGIGFIFSYQGLLENPSNLLWYRFFALSFISLFFFSSLSLVSFFKSVKNTDYFSSTIVSVFVVFYVFTLISKDTQSVFLIFASILFMGASYYFYSLKLDLNIIKSYSIPSCLLLLVATFVEFSGPTLLIILCIQALLIPYALSKAFSKDSTYFILFSAPVVFTTTIALSGLSSAINSLRYSSVKTYYSNPPALKLDINQSFLSLFCALIYFLILGIYFYLDIKNNIASKTLSKIYFVFLGVYLIIFNWLYVDLLFKNSNVTSIVNLILISIAGLSLYFTGVAKISSYIKNYGIVLLALVVIRLLGYEVWQMDTIIYRIIVFFGVGMVFVLSVLLPKKLINSK